MISKIESIESEGKVLKKKTYRRFTSLDCEAIARLMAQRFTEEQACEHLDIKKDTFQKWRKKGGNESFFVRTFTRARAKILNSHLENIEDASLGRGAHQKADWRASKALIDHSFPELIPQSGNVSVTNNTLNIGVMHEALKKVIGIQAEPLQLKQASIIPPRKR